MKGDTSNVRELGQSIKHLWSVGVSVVCKSDVRARVWGGGGVSVPLMLMLLCADVWLIISCNVW